jgi:hypothetical protein
VLSCPEALDEQVCRSPGLVRLATREHIGSCIAILGPSVNGDVGFCNGQDTCNTLWSKLVERLSNNMKPHFARDIYKGLPHISEVVQKALIAAL